MKGRGSYRCGWGGVRWSYRVGFCEVGWVILGWGGSCSETTPPKSFLEGVQNLNFEYKKLLLLLLLLQLCYIPNYTIKLLPDAPCIKILMA